MIHFDWSEVITEELKSKTAEDNDVEKWVQQLTRSGRAYQPQVVRVEEASKTPVQPEESRVVEQLKKTQAQISMWGLLVSSKPHRTALLKLLDEAIVPTESTPEQFTAMVATLGLQNCLSFSDEDLSPLGKHHDQALHITVETRGMVVPNVLIDNG